MLTLVYILWLSNRKFATNFHLHYALRKSSLNFPRAGLIVQHQFSSYLLYSIIIYVFSFCCLISTEWRRACRNFLTQNFLLYNWKGMKGNAPRLGTKQVILLLIYYFPYIATWRLPSSSAAQCLKLFTKLSNTWPNSPWFQFAVSFRTACFSCCIVCGRLLCTHTLKQLHKQDSGRRDVPRRYRTWDTQYVTMLFVAN